MPGHGDRGVDARRDRGSPEPPPRAAGVIGVGRAYVLLGAVVLFWGVNWPIMKIGLAFIPPLWFAGLRMSIAAAVLFALLFAIGRLRPPPRHDLPVVLSVGLLQMTVTTALMYLGLTYVEAGRAALLSYTTPLWIAPLAVMFLGERVDRRAVAGIAVGLGGLVLMFNPLSFDWADTDTVVGNAVLTVSAVVWAVAILHVRGHRWRSTTLALAPWQLLLAGIVLCAAAGLFEDAGRIRWSAWSVTIMAYNGVVATAFCFWAVLAITRALPAVTTSVVMLAVPVAGVLFSSALLSEPLTPALIGGLVLIVAGIALVSLRRNPRQPNRGV